MVEILSFMKLMFAEHVLYASLVFHPGLIVTVTICPLCPYPPTFPRNNRTGKEEVGLDSVSLLKKHLGVLLLLVQSQ